MSFFFSNFKSVNDLEISVSAFNNSSSLFLTSSFNFSISFISSFSDNLNFILSSRLFNFLEDLFLSVPCSNSNCKFFDISFISSFNVFDFISVSCFISFISCSLINSNFFLTLLMTLNYSYNF